MLPAAARMRTSGEFAATLRSGARAGTSSLVAHARVATPGLTGVRVGFVVPRSAGSAVVRNRLLRRLRHLMRARLAGLPPGTSVVVRANATAAGVSAAELAAGLDDVVARAVRGSTGTRR